MEPDHTLYCPDCGAECPAGCAECPDCGAPIEAEAQRPADPSLEVVTVMETADPLLLAWARSVLDEAGIAYYIVGEELGVRYGPIGPFLQPFRQIQVAADREAEARSLLEQVGEDRP